MTDERYPIMTPNEGRLKFNLRPVALGETVHRAQTHYSMRNVHAIWFGSPYKPMPKMTPLLSRDRRRMRRLVRRTRTKFGVVQHRKPRLYVWPTRDVFMASQ